MLNLGRFIIVWAMGTVVQRVLMLMMMMMVVDVDAVVDVDVNDVFCAVVPCYAVTCFAVAFHARDCSMYSGLF